MKVDLITGLYTEMKPWILPNEFKISFVSRWHPIPVCSLRLLQSCIDEKGSSKASAELKHVISTRSHTKTHLFNMPLNLTTTKHLTNLRMQVRCDGNYNRSNSKFWRFIILKTRHKKLDINLTRIIVNWPVNITSMPQRTTVYKIILTPLPQNFFTLLLAKPYRFLL